MNIDLSRNAIEAINEMVYPDTLENNIRLMEDLMQLFIDDKVQVSDEEDDPRRCLDYIRAINSLRKNLVKLNTKDNEN